MLNGYGDGTFRPNWGITRAEFTTLMVQCLGLEIGNDENIYLDMGEHWAIDYVATGTKHKIVYGIGEDLFDPDTIITREQMAAIIFRMSGEEEIWPISEFTDREECTPYARPAIDYVNANGIMVGMNDGTFRGLEPTTRAQAASVVLRLIKAKFFDNPDLYKDYDFSEAIY